MNLDELRSVQRAERQRDSLQHLPDEFYTEVARYVGQLKDERERAMATADDPFTSDDVRRLTDTIESATEIANALYERRVGKVVKHASFAAADMATEQEGMTVEERELFDDLVARIRENRESVLATIEGTADTAPTATESAAGADEHEPTGTGVPADPDPATGVEGQNASRGDDADHVTPTGSDGSGPDDLLSDALGDAGTTQPATATREADPEPDRSSTTSDASGASDAPGARETADALAPSEAVDGEADGHPTSRDDGVGSPREGGSAGTDAPSPTPGRDGSTDASPGDDAGSRTDADREGGADDAVETDRTMLRITADVGTVYGVDEREYDLVREDVVTLPTTNAQPLLQKDAAERID
jgi:DNA replication factor GINS